MNARPRTGRGIPPAPPVVLVIDDDPMIASLVRDILESDGYRVLIAGSVADAESVLLEHPIDLMAVDATLPDDDGVDWLIRRLRSGGEGPRAAFVITGAYPEPDTLDRLHERGVEVVEKPFGVNRILRTARRVLAAGPDGAA